MNPPQPHTPASFKETATQIIRLSSDIGSAFSIVNAADAGSDIFTKIQLIYNSITLIAYHAEKITDANNKPAIKRLYTNFMETDKLLSEFIGMIVRMKALNPLISDELVSIVSTLKKDAAIVLASLTAIVENDGGDKAGTDERV